MDEDDFEGTVVLEKLVEAGKLDAFYEAIDSDDFDQARRLLRGAGVDAETIQIVIKKMAEADGKY